jgi:hypothetical protein
MKKAQGLPITVIIIAALGILVLVVIAAIFGGQIGKFGRVTGECPGKCIVRARPIDYDPSAQFEVRASGACNLEFETSLSGTYIARNTPKNADLNDYRCDACCVATG